MGISAGRGCRRRPYGRAAGSARCRPSPFCRAADIPLPHVGARATFLRPSPACLQRRRTSPVKARCSFGHGRAAGGQQPRRTLGAYRRYGRTYPRGSGNIARRTPLRIFLVQNPPPPHSQGIKRVAMPNHLLAKSSEPAPCFHADRLANKFFWMCCRGFFQRLQTRVANRQAPVVDSLIKNANGRLKFISGLVVAGASGPGASSSPVHVTPAPSAPSSVNSIVAFWNILDIASTGVVKMTYLLSCPRSEIPRVASGTLRAIFPD